MANGCFKMLATLCITGILCLGVSAVDETTEVGETVTLTCPLVGSFPDWFGPPDLSPLTSNNDVTAEGMEYVDDKDLRINNVSLEHAGEYRCRGSGEAMVTLIVNSYAYHIEFRDVQMIRVPGEPDTHALTPSTGQSYMIACTVRNGFPEPEVALTIPESNVTIDEAAVVKEATLENNTFTVVVSALLSPEQVAEIDELSAVCTATKGDKSVNKRQLIRVLHPSSGVSQEGPDVLDTSNSTGRYSCTESDVWPPVIINWSYNGSANLPSRFDTTHTCTKGAEGLYTCKSEIIADMTKMDNGLILSCSVQFVDAETSLNQFIINFDWKPSSVTILGESTVDGPDGGVATATCETDSHNDQSETPFKFMWSLGPDNTDVTFTVINDTTDDGDHNGMKTTQTVEFPVMKNMSGYMLKCYMDYNEDIKDTKSLRVFYAPIFILPYSTTIHAYIDRRLDVPCRVDSLPPATMSISYDSTAISTTDDNLTDNLLTYSIDKVLEQNSAKAYVCTADNGVFPPVTNTFQISAYEFPGMPVCVLTSDVHAASTDFRTSSSPPEVPRTFYVQYKLTTSDHWLEMTPGIPDTQPGQSSRRIQMQIENLEPASQYKMRLKSVDINGLEAYTAESSFSTKETEETVTYTEYRNAILISVFATFGFMLLLGAILICCYKRGVCLERIQRRKRQRKSEDRKD